MHPPETPTLDPRSRYFLEDGSQRPQTLSPGHARLLRGIRIVLWLSTIVAVLGIWLEPAVTISGRPHFAVQCWSFMSFGIILANCGLIAAYWTLFLAGMLPEFQRMRPTDYGLAAVAIWVGSIVAALAMLGPLIVLVGLLMVIDAIPFHLMWLCGWRFVYAPAYAPHRQQSQFSLAWLFGVTTITAVALGIAAAILRVRDHETAALLGLVAMATVLGLWPVIWFLPRPVSAWIGGIVLVAGAAAVWYWSVRVRAFWPLLVFGTNLTVCHGVAIAVQRAGFRLLRLPEEMRRRSEPNVES